MSGFCAVTSGESALGGLGLPLEPGSAPSSPGYSEVDSAKPTPGETLVKQECKGLLSALAILALCLTESASLSVKWGWKTAASEFQG